MLPYYIDPSRTTCILSLECKDNQGFVKVQYNNLISLISCMTCSIDMCSKCSSSHFDDKCEGCLTGLSYSTSLRKCVKTCPSGEFSIVNQISGFMNCEDACKQTIPNCNHQRLTFVNLNQAESVSQPQRVINVKLDFGLWTI